MTTQHPGEEEMVQPEPTVRERDHSLSNANAEPSAARGPYDNFGEDEFGPDGEDGEPWDDCGLMPDGQCTKAGSEECDWECGRLHR